MKVRSVVVNNRKRAFEVRTHGREYIFPFAVCRPRPTAVNRVDEVWVDREIAREGFSYRLHSGSEGTIHMDHVLEYNRDPNYLADLLLYRLTLEAQNRLAKSPHSARELIRRLRTSPAQFYRLLDQTNYRKSIRQMLSLLQVLECEVDLIVRSKKSA